MKSHYLKYELITEVTQYSVEIIDIQNKIIDKKEFEIDLSKPTEYFKY